MSEIVISPFSNSDIRDWPAELYEGLVGEILDRSSAETRIRVIGTAAQRARARPIVRPYSSARVTNECGRLSWPAVLDLLSKAACVVGNNSGIAHVAGHLGTPTVCIFSGSHQRLEWRPLGPKVVTVSRLIACSPCHLDHGARCPYDKACLRQIAPEEVADVIGQLCPDLLGGAPERVKEGSGAKTRATGDVEAQLPVPGGNLRRGAGSAQGAAPA